MDCKLCNDKLFTLHEMDEYQMCDACYCDVWDRVYSKQKQKQKTETGETK